MTHIEHLKHNILAYHDNAVEGTYLYDWFHQELDDYVNRMWCSERENFLSEFGLDRALECYFDNFDGKPTVALLVYAALEHTLMDDIEIVEFLQQN